MIKKRYSITIITLLVIITAIISSAPMISNSSEIPNYKVLKSDGKIEFRQYDPMIIAQVKMSGKRKKAVGKGFRPLAGYIFGGNTIDQKISMTAPVQQQKSQKIAMTAPVQQQLDGDEWNVSFVMPSEYKMEDLPTPNNDMVEIKQVPVKKFIVIRFSGRNSDKNIKKHETKLMDYIEKNNISVTGSPKYAFYNPPWTLPILRRNEVMLEIK